MLTHALPLGEVLIVKVRLDLDKDCIDLRTWKRVNFQTKRSKRVINLSSSGWLATRGVPTCGPCRTGGTTYRPIRKQ